MAPDRDPFDDLRLPQVPLAVDRAFAARLRRQIEAALTPTQETAMTDPIATTTATTTATPDAVTGSATLSPYLAVLDAASAIDWYRDVFGAVETLRYVGDDGRVGHAELSIGSATIMLADEYPEMGVRGPVSYGGTPVMLHLQVTDVDHTYSRAVGAGAEAQRPPADQGHGNRNATIVDPYGHRWMLSQAIDPERAIAADTADPDAGAGRFTITGRAPVEPGYLVLHSADVERAKAFFGALLGWRAEPGGHVENTHFPLGLTGPADAGTTSVYFRVDDIEPYAAQVIELGGRVIARTEYPSGANAECEDDQGYRFYLWKPAPGY